jgi:hypothetical protein
MLRGQRAADLRALALCDRIDLRPELRVGSGSLVRLAELLHFRAVLLGDRLDGSLLVVVQLETGQGAASSGEITAAPSTRAHAVGTAAATPTRATAIGIEHTRGAKRIQPMLAKRIGKPAAERITVRDADRIHPSRAGGIHDTRASRTTAWALRGSDGRRAHEGETERCYRQKTTHL